jgi:hypothetical protein
MRQSAPKAHTKKKKAQKKKELLAKKKEDIFPKVLSGNRISPSAELWSAVFDIPCCIARPRERPEVKGAEKQSSSELNMVSPETSTDGLLEAVRVTCQPTHVPLVMVRTGH